MVLFMKVFMRNNFFCNYKNNTKQESSITREISCEHQEIKKAQAKESQQEELQKIVQNLCKRVFFLEKKLESYRKRLFYRHIK